MWLGTAVSGGWRARLDCNFCVWPLAMVYLQLLETSLLEIQFSWFYAADV